MSRVMNHHPSSSVGVIGGGGGAELTEDMIALALRMASEMQPDEAIGDLENNVEFPLDQDYGRMGAHKQRGMVFTLFRRLSLSLS